MYVVYIELTEPISLIDKSKSWESDQSGHSIVEYAFNYLPASLIKSMLLKHNHKTAVGRFPV